MPFTAIVEPGSDASLAPCSDASATSNPTLPSNIFNFIRMVVPPSFVSLPRAKIPTRETIRGCRRSRENASGARRRITIRRGPALKLPGPTAPTARLAAKQPSAGGLLPCCNKAELAHVSIRYNALKQNERGLYSVGDRPTRNAEEGRGGSDSKKDSDKACKVVDDPVDAGPFFNVLVQTIPITCGAVPP